MATPNKIPNIQPIAIGTSVSNLLNCAVSSLTGPVGFTLTQPWLNIKHIRLNNKTGAAITVTLYKGASGASAAGTEFAFSAVSIPANSSLDYNSPGTPFYSTDFLTGVASATGVTMNVEAEVGFS
jgi:hypothetical protein